MKLKIKRLHSDAIIPAYQTDGAACFDLTAISQSGQVFGTGLSFEVPQDQGGGMSHG